MDSIYDDLVDKDTIPVNRTNWVTRALLLLVLTITAVILYFVIVLVIALKANPYL